MAKKSGAGKYALIILAIAAVAGGIFYVVSSGPDKTRRNVAETGRQSSSSESAKTQSTTTSSAPASTTLSTSKDNESSGTPKEQTEDSSASQKKSSPEKNLGFVTKVYDRGGKRFLRIDYVQLLGGTEAARALIEDGGCTGTIEECIPPNDYYLRNRNPRIRTFEISKSADILVEMPNTEGPDGRLGKKSISYTDFKSYFDGSETNESSAPYWIVVEGNKVTSITLMYTP